jgi:hypothetical protein
MATLNVRNESNKFITLLNDSFIHKPASETEDVTVEITDVTSDKIFNIFSDEACSNFLGLFRVIFRANDGVYLVLENVGDVMLNGDFNFASNIVVFPATEEKLLDWVSLTPSTILNVTLSVNS